MKIEKFLDFYIKCKTAGYVKLLHDDKSNGSVSIVAPVKGGVGSIQVYVFDESDMDFYKLMKPVCWISNTHSYELLDKMNLFIIKSQNKLKAKHIDEKINYTLTFKKNKVKIISSSESIKKLESIKLKLFTVNEDPPKIKK